MQRTILATAMATIAVFSGCAGDAGQAPPGGSSLALSVAAHGSGAVAYDVKLYEQSPSDPRSFVLAKTLLNQAPTATDGSFSASLPCRVLPPGAVGLVDVVAHLPTVNGNVADSVQDDLGEVDPDDLASTVGAQLEMARNSRPFVCVDQQATPVSFAMTTAARGDGGLASMSVPLKDQTVAMEVADSDARVATTDLTVTSPTLPDIYTFGFADTALLGVHQSDAAGGRRFSADWQLPATGATYSLAAFATLFQPGEELQNGGSAYVWGAGRAADANADWSMVDTFRLLEAGRVTDGTHTNVGAIINCRTAQIAGGTGSTGVNMFYAQDVKTQAINTTAPIYYLHLVNGTPVPAQAIGVIEMPNAELALLLHEVITPTTIFATKCGFARPDGKGGLTGSCDETTPGSGILHEYSLAELAASN